MKNFELRISNWELSGIQVQIQNSQFEIRNCFGPEAHQDEFSTFNRGVVGSTPTRPTKELRIADFELSGIKSEIRNSKFAIPCGH